MGDPSIQQHLVTGPSDGDPQETAEWRDALAAMLAASGVQRVREMLDMLAAVGRSPPHRMATGARNAVRQHHPRSSPDPVSGYGVLDLRSALSVATCTEVGVR